MSLDTLKRTATARTGDEPTLADRLASLSLDDALPPGFDPPRFLRAVLTAVRQNPELSACTWQSLAGAVMTAAQLGLEPGPLGHCWLIPRYNRDAGGKVASFQLGWTGVLELARRSGRLGTVDGGAFYAGELVTERYGTDPALEIVPRRPRPEGAEPAGYWVSVEFLDGSRPRFKVADRADIDAHAARHAPKNQRGDLVGAWASDFDTMAVISVFRSLRNWLPLSPDMHHALTVDGQVVEHDTRPTGQLLDRLTPAQRPHELPEPPAVVSPTGDPDEGPVVEQTDQPGEGGDGVVVVSGEQPDSAPSSPEPAARSRRGTR